ncbi:MAG: hypothetical protein GY772_11760 [bacterium]|nr:hypothetical protein [bacterium]
MIDLTPGEGILALEAYKNNVVYLGFTFTESHKQMLQGRLDKIAAQALLQDDNAMYSAKLHMALTSAMPSPSGLPAAAGAAGAGGRGGRRGRPRGRGGRGRGSKPVAVQGEDDGEGGGKGGEGGDGENADEDDDLSGDDE